MSVTCIKVNFSGGVDIINNAGNGQSQISLTGLTERLPLGILLQDSDFLGEDPANNGISSFKAYLTGLQVVQSPLPLALNGEEYSRYLANPNTLIALCDGSILQYQAYNEQTAPTGTKSFRLYRGGGSAFILSGENAGGPIIWSAGSFAASEHPILKGAILTGTALLVRSFSETALSEQAETALGDEIHMLILTSAVFQNSDSIQLTGIISPTGYGEGYSAADRYRLIGKPLITSTVQKELTVDMEATPLAPF